MAEFGCAFNRLALSWTLRKASDLPQVAGEMPTAHPPADNRGAKGRKMLDEAPESQERQAPIDPPAPLHVFISYASQDAAVAAALVESLERHGIACWIAPRNVKAGALYADAIVRAISAARAFVLVLSESAIASSHVSKEIERASSKKRPIIALRIDSAPLTPALEYFLSESQWVEAQAGHQEAAYAKVIEAIHEPARAASETLAMPPGMSAGTVAAAHPRSRRNWMLLAAGIVFVAVALAALLADKAWISKQVSQEKTASPVASAGVPASPGISEKSIAVLPFTDMSEKHDQEYFGDGMAEEIIDLLVKIPNLTVIGRTSSFQFKGKNADLRTIGTQLNAAHVIEGSVRKSGDQVRITAQLINTRTGTDEWSETYDRHIGDVLKLQDAIAAAVVRELQLSVASEYLSSRSTLKNDEVYDLILRGRHAEDHWNQEGFDEAITLFRQALDRDPTSADAAAELADAYLDQGDWAFLAPPAAFEQPRRWAATALKLDPKSAHALFVLGSVHMVYDWDWAAAELAFKQAATLAPGSADPLHGQADLSLVLGRWDDALRQMKAALARDPLDPTAFYMLSVIQARRGDLAEAEAASRRLLEIRPTYAWGHFGLGLIMLYRGDRDGALLEMQQETDDTVKQEGLATVYHALGRKADSDAALTRLTKEHAERDASGIAAVYAFRGNGDEAMRWLERAYAQKDFAVCYVKSDLRLKGLEGDTRFKAFLRKMNLPE
jgi:adenylate cyclase